MDRYEFSLMSYQVLSPNEADVPERLLNLSGKFGNEFCYGAWVAAPAADQ